MMRIPAFAYLTTQLAVSLICVSCANLSRNARRSNEAQPAANDTIVGTGNLAKTLARSTTYGAIRQPITTTILGVSVLWNRPHEAISSNMPLKIDLAVQPAEIPGTVEFEKLLDHKGIPKAESGKLTWLVDGEHFFPELNRQIDAAQKSIDAQVFIFDNDDISVACADRLKGRSREVKTHILFDDLGSTFAHNTPPHTLPPAGFTPPADMAKYLEHDSKVSARRSINPWLVCDHTKLFVFDRKTAILGGMNIGREYYSEWHDLMVKVEGPVVRTLSKDFNYSWRKAGPWGDFGLLLHGPSHVRRPEPMPGEIPVRVMRTDPAAFRYEILKATMLAIRAARTRVWVENPYLANNEIVSALAAASKRGVDVRVILPSNGDSGIMDLANLSTAKSLIEAGVKVYAYPKMTHMKVMICDDWASIGSANFDTLSMRINRELNLAFNDPGEVRALEQKVFRRDFQVCSRLSLKQTESLLSTIVGRIANQL
ncbi:phosphatidylserine/phosphatidylglycerophosphate/cardiolipin synthase family protein [Luteolibacter pohnpeiensis]|uniref:Phosphatidylserine/phosphatidylglycerophosphate/ cardiolipin synthase family protein n=1 Tax=Luteolibacter pohnpeiensis TaxID=454153 RepID=A0A934VVA8_9BACT|nr:phosphatidylserine/phosphatidylglycerophosphate/cardiolipin synthase family protein [Luteolibacter pohnpeiensis]MBK1881344.1 phosphatidylserine/phosphatidylglycerophosphate/cardiolipin synthase family protein [Luteolibacter pohnpeiensis]